MSHQIVRARERVPTGRRGRPSKSMIAAAMERPFCAYLHKICLNNRLEGHRFCIDHIMNDKTAPYRVCTYVHSVTGRRCNRAAHKVDRRASPLCHYHKSLKLNAPPTSSVQIDDDSRNPKALLRELEHHIEPKSDPEKKDDILVESNANQTQTKPQISPQTNTFWITKPDGSAVPSMKLCKTLATFNTKRQPEHLTPIELPTLEEIAARHNNADSDTESVDNQDVFRHASVYTEEELTRTLRDKMIQLKRLYVHQYSHIRYILKEKRLKYIQAQRIEDELYGEMYSFRNNRDSPEYPKLRAMLKYHKTFGPQALLQDQAKKKRMSRQTISHQSRQELDNQNNDTPNANSHHQNQSQSYFNSPYQQNTCIFSKTPQGCDKPSIPLSPYCRHHILYDTKQVLFRPCAGGMPPCLTPVVSYVRKNKCWLHTVMNCPAPDNSPAPDQSVAGGISLIR